MGLEVIGPCDPLLHLFEKYLHNTEFLQNGGYTEPLQFTRQVIANIPTSKVRSQYMEYLEPSISTALLDSFHSAATGVSQSYTISSTLQSDVIFPDYFNNFDSITHKQLLYKLRYMVCVVTYGRVFTDT